MPKEEKLRTMNIASNKFFQNVANENENLGAFLKEIGFTE